MRLRFLLPAVAAVLLLAGPTRADFTYQFADSSGTATNAFSVTVGSTINIRVYLLQQGGSTNLSSNGLVDGGVALQYSSSSPHASISSASNITPNSAFGGPNNNSLSTSSGTTSAVVQVHDNAGVFAPTSGTDANRILLGTFTFTGNTTGSTTINTAFPDANNPNNVDGANNNLDSMVHLPTAAISVVPEPSAMALCGIGAVALGVGAWRRRRGKTPVA
jgi:hypothetical protein